MADHRGAAAQESIKEAPSSSHALALRQERDPKNAPLEERVRDLEAQVQTLEDQLAQARRESDAIRNSTIWRLSQPLRRALSANQSLRRSASSVARLAINGVARLRGHRLPAPGQPTLRAQVRSLVARGLTKAVRVSGVAPERLPTRLRRLVVLPSSSARRIPTAGQIPAHDFTRPIQIEFVWKNTATPAAHGLSTDTRALAVGFADLVVWSKAGPDAKPLAHINFRCGGNAMSHVLYGFGQLEPWGAWSTGGRSAVMVWMPEDAPATVHLEISASVFGPLGAVEADILVDCAPSGSLNFDGLTLVGLDLSARRSETGAWASNNVSLDRNAVPDVSVIILDYNKPGITIAAVAKALKSRTDLRYEIIVLENGSAPDRVDVLRAAKLPVRIIEQSVNRYFGEGNNIAAEHARSEVFVFLNNDAFLSDGVLDALVAPLRADPAVGAVGPVFHYPDGMLQEAGAFLDADGSAYQRGKFSKEFDVAMLPDYDTVDYVSAACLAVRSDDFFALGGFDLRYDPAYYEDSDLCLRLAALGKRTVVASRAQVIHVENATSSDPANRGIATDIVERHREVFLARWGEWLANRSNKTAPAIEAFSPLAIRDSVRRGAEASKINAVYTPFGLYPGGGERYILGVASALSEKLPTAVVSPDDYSALRLNTLSRELGFAPYRTFPQSARNMHTRDVACAVMMGNELLPTTAGFGQKRVYHCQFPFPTPNGPEEDRRFARNLLQYKAVVVNSVFTRDAYLAALAEAPLPSAPPPVVIIPPPVRLLRQSGGEGPPRKERLLITIGRFTPFGHAKRHDVVLAAFAELVRTGVLKGWSLALCGVVPNEPDAIAYYENIAKTAAATPGATLVLSPSRAKLEDLLWRARVYVSATGFNIDPAKQPWRCEHFGITVVEAASAGCVPVVCNVGGPAEIVAAIGAGHTFDSMRTLRQQILAAARSSEDAAVRNQLMEGAQVYDEAHFAGAWRELFERID